MGYLLKNEDVTFDQMANVRSSYLNAVKQSVLDCQKTLPTDIAPLDSQELIKLQTNVKNFIDQILAKNKELKDERMELTRRLDEVKKFFTTNEKAAEEEVAPLIAYTNKIAKELVKRQREEAAKIEAEHKAREYLSTLKINIDKHYSLLLKTDFVNYFGALKERIYKMGEAELQRVPQKLDSIKGGAKARIEDLVQSNPFKLEILNEETTSVLYECKKSYETGLYKELIEYYNNSLEELYVLCKTRLLQIKEGAVDPETDVNKLKSSHEAELMKVANEVEDAAKASQLAATIETVAATSEASTTDVSKIKVKLRYDPENHAQLLEIIKLYIAEKYESESLPTLLNRLSFMVTYANNRLNSGHELNVNKVEDIKVK
ncbi:MAG TPA: hypothetical protein VIL57_07360 [Bacteroidia bacterium]